MQCGRSVGALGRLRLFSTKAQQVTLRPYQSECIDAILSSLDRGKRRLAVSLPTASGKTTIFSALIPRIKSLNPRASKTLVLVGTIELARQAADRIGLINPDLTVEIEQGSQNIASGQADATVATYQTLISQDDSRLAKFDPDLYKCIIVDEAHHAAARSWLRILAHFDPSIQFDKVPVDAADLVSRPPPTTTSMPIIGFSATFSRHDGLALSAVFDEVVYHKDFVEQIKEGWLSPVSFTTVKANLKLDEVSTSQSSGDFSAPSLSKAINTPEVNEVIIQAWRDNASQRKTTLVFAVDVAHVNSLAKAFNQSGVEARVLTGQTPSQIRVEVLDDFKAGRFPVLINCAILTEGADIPNIDAVLLARPTLSRNLFAQMIGRGLRLSPETGKRDCLILDLVSNTKHGLICSPSLFGLDPAIELTEASIDEVERLAELHPAPEEQSQSLTTSEIRYAEFSLDEMLNQKSFANLSLYSVSFNDWVPCGSGIFVLDLLGHGFIRVERTPDGYSSHFCRPFRQGKHRYAKAVKVYSDKSDADFARCIRTCDTFASRLPAFAGTSKARGLIRTAHWRSQPASEAQQARLLAKCGPDRLHTMLNLRAGQSERPIEAITKGEASRIFIQMQHGSSGRLKKYESAKERDSIRQATKEKRHKPIKVGPTGR